MRGHLLLLQGLMVLHTAYLGGFLENLEILEVLGLLGLVVLHLPRAY